MFSFFKKTFDSTFQKIKEVFLSNTDQREKKQKIYQLLTERNFKHSTAEKISDQLILLIKNESDQSSKKISDFLENILFTTLEPIQEITYKKDSIYFLVGVNGSGKTTTAIKLARFAKGKGDSPLLIAADTFRAAAQDQLQNMGNIYQIPVYRDETTQNATTTVFNGIKNAIIERCSPIIIDTAGRIHQNENLLKEIKKIYRVTLNAAEEKKEVVPIMIIDTLQGKSIEDQLQQFLEYIPLKGIIITKMDAGLKPGILFSLIEKSPLPIFGLCYGEHTTELIPFDKREFCKEMTKE